MFIKPVARDDFIHDGDIARAYIARYALPKEITMNTVKDKMPSSRKNRTSP
jgi:hypothetical protein